MNDYIRLPRSALTGEMEQNGDLARLLVYLLRRSDGNGEITTDMVRIAADLGLSRQSVRTLIKKIEANQILTKSSTTRVTKYKLECQNVKPKRQPRNQPNHQPNSNQIKPIKFTPPTDAEVAAYVAEKGYHFNPEQFVPFYKSKDWKIGGQPMKDWRAACRTWELRWKEKHGERFYYEIQPTAGRGTLSAQTDRYSELERAAQTLLRDAPDIYAM